MCKTLKQRGPIEIRERLKICLTIFVMSEAHSLRTCPGMLSGPAALCVFTLLTDLYTSEVWVHIPLRQVLLPALFMVLCSELQSEHNRG